MNKHVSRGLMGALFVGGIWALGTTAANAAPATSGDDGLLSGTQVAGVVEAPVSALGNAVSVLGDSSSTAVEAAAEPAAAPSAPIAPVASAPAPAPVAATVAAAPAPAPAPAAPVTTTSGDSGLLSGTQGIVSVDVPVTVGGNAISVLGDSASAPAPAPVAPAAPAVPVATAPVTTSGDDSIGSGTQALVDATLPVTIGGNAISVLGDSSSTGTTTGTPAGGAAGVVPAAGGTTSGDDAILGGTQVVPSTTLPIDVSGNAVSVIGDSDTTGGTTGTTPTDPATPTDPTFPVDPAEPFEPTDPVTPTVPGDVTTTPGTGTTTTGTTGAVLVTASSGRAVLGSATSASSVLAADSSLAYTGGDTTAPLAGALLALLAGLGLLVAARRRSARA